MWPLSSSSTLTSGSPDTRLRCYVYRHSYGLMSTGHSMLSSRTQTRRPCEVSICFPIQSHVWKNQSSIHLHSQPTKPKRTHKVEQISSQNHHHSVDCICHKPKSHHAKTQPNTAMADRAASAPRAATATATTGTDRPDKTAVCSAARAEAEICKYFNPTDSRRTMNVQHCRGKPKKYV
jgi:hypothetical protein